MRTLKRDQKSGAVLNMDLESLNKYKKDKMYYKKVESLEVDITDIKKCLLHICEKIDKLQEKRP